jgi:hypothetical protein
MTQDVPSSSALVWSVRIAAVASVLSVLWQGFSASFVIVSQGSALGPHEAGAVVAHVVTGLLALAAAAHWWRTRGALWPAVVAVVVFVATFVEAALGHLFSLWAHVPLALLIMLGVGSVLVWAFAPARRAVRT